DDYLVKPFAARELLARVSTHLSLARMRTVAEKERSRLHELLMQAPVPVAVLAGPEHRFQLANPSWCEMVNRQDLVGKTVREAFPELADQPMWTILDEAYRTGETKRHTEFHVSVARRDGERNEGWFDFVVQPLRDEAGSVTGLMAVTIDVT